VKRFKFGFDVLSYHEDTLYSDHQIVNTKWHNVVKAELVNYGSTHPSGYHMIHYHLGPNVRNNLQVVNSTQAADNFPAVQELELKMFPVATLPQSSTICEAKLRKQHTLLSFHRVSEDIAAKMIVFTHIDGPVTQLISLASIEDIISCGIAFSPCFPEQVIL
jgi:hypothetical protein